MSYLMDIGEITQSQLEEICRLASLNLSPTEIALCLKYDKGQFKKLWAMEDHPIREAYDRGCILSKSNVAAELERRVLTGNITSIQIHDKKSAERNFQDIKKQIFSAEI